MAKIFASLHYQKYQWAPSFETIEKLFLDFLSTVAKKCVGFILGRDIGIGAKVRN